MENEDKKYDLPSNMRSDLEGNLSFLRFVGQLMELYVTRTGEVFLGMAKCIGQNKEEKQ